MTDLATVAEPMNPTNDQGETEMTESYTDADVESVINAYHWAARNSCGPDNCPGAAVCVYAEHLSPEPFRAALDALAAAGRLLPEATQESTEWGVWWHATDPEGIVMTDYQHPRREQAERTAKERIGQYGITGYSLVKCEHRRHADGSTWTSAWDRVETVMP